MKKFEHLGVKSENPIDTVEVFEVDIIRTIDVDLRVELNATEFTSRCPVTKMPDYGRIEIIYRPFRHLIETKSLKLYLMKWRDVEQFNEVIVGRICDELFTAVQPMYMEVTGTFGLRGGIGVTASAERRNEFRPAGGKKDGDPF